MKFCYSSAHGGTRTRDPWHGDRTPYPFGHAAIVIVVVMIDVYIASVTNFYACFYSQYVLTALLIRFL